MESGAIWGDGGLVLCVVRPGELLQLVQVQGQGGAVHQAERAVILDVLQGDHVVRWAAGIQCPVGDHDSVGAHHARFPWPLTGGGGGGGGGGGLGVVSPWWLVLASCLCSQLMAAVTG